MGVGQYNHRGPGTRHPAGAGAAVTCGEVAGELAGDIPVRSVAGLAFGEPQHADIFDPRPPQSFGWAGSSSSQREMKS